MGSHSTLELVKEAVWRVATSSLYQTLNDKQLPSLQTEHNVEAHCMPRFQWTTMKPKVLPPVSTHALNHSIVVTLSLVTKVVSRFADNCWGDVEDDMPV
eukprot:4205402-Amphidinium_carterae.2